MNPKDKNIAKTNTDTTKMVNPYSTNPTSAIGDPIAFSPTDLKTSEPLLDIPNVPTDTTFDGAEGEFASLTEQNQAFINNLQKQRDDARQASSTSFDQYIQSLAEGKSVDELSFNAEQEAGLPELEQELNRINSDLLQEQRALKKRIDKLNANAGGGLASGVAGEIANAQRESYSRQADLAVVQMAAQGRFDSAQKWANQKAMMMFAQQERVIGIREKIFENNKSFFEQADNRAFQVKTDEMKRRLEQERQDEMILQDTKLQALKMAQMNGAPVDILQSIQGAKTPQDVVSAGGKWGASDLLQRESLRASIANSWASYDLNKLKLDQEKRRQQEIQDALDSGEIILDDSQKDMAFKLSKEFESESAEFKKQVGAYNRIIASAEDPSAAGDLALIFNYMKMLDPGSTVREGEFANAENSAGVPSRIQAQYNKLINGERLTTEQRTDFVSRSQDIYDTSLDQQMELEKRYKEKGTMIFGLPENAADYIIQDIRAVGSTSNIAFALQLDNASVDQLAELAELGLLPTSSPTQ